MLRMLCYSVISLMYIFYTCEFTSHSLTAQVTIVNVPYLIKIFTYNLRIQPVIHTIYRLQVNAFICGLWESGLWVASFC
jgi:hypothetical protein